MKINKSRALEVNSLRSEIKILKDRINLMEAILDIQRLKGLLKSETTKENDRDVDLNLPSNSDN